MKDKILILDFGSQYTQLIARRVRELGVFSEIQPFHYGLNKILADPPAGIILSGGPASTPAPGAPRVDKKLFAAGIPILGICYGMQLMTRMLGGKVRALVAARVRQRRTAHRGRLAPARRSRPTAAPSG